MDEFASSSRRFVIGVRQPLLTTLLRDAADSASPLPLFCMPCFVPTSVSRCADAADRGSQPFLIRGSLKHSHAF